jgi:hypothetical protein
MINSNLFLILAQTYYVNNYPVSTVLILKFFAPYFRDTFSKLNSSHFQILNCLESNLTLLIEFERKIRMF